MTICESLSTVGASLLNAPAPEKHFWIKPSTDEVVYGPQVHSDLVELHWQDMGLPADQTHSMFDAIAHGWARVRITPETAIIHANALRDAQRILAFLLDHAAVMELPITVSIEEIRIVWHQKLGKRVAVADLAKTRSFQLRGFEDAERFMRGVTRFAELATVP